MTFVDRNKTKSVSRIGHPNARRSYSSVLKMHYKKPVTFLYCGTKYRCDLASQHPSVIEETPGDRIPCWAHSVLIPP
jgi:hypothetical protein